MPWWGFLVVAAVPLTVFAAMEAEGTRLGNLFVGCLMCGVLAVPVLVATGVAPHWFWIFF